MGADMSDGASQSEQLIYAAKNDDDTLINSILSSCSAETVNKSDGLGNTPLHYAALTPSPDALDALLDSEHTDVDLRNRLDGDTPLHCACRITHVQAREYCVTALLDAGADPRIKNKHAQLPSEFIRGQSEEDESLKARIRMAIAELSVDLSHVAAADADEGDDGSESD